MGLLPQTGGRHFDYTVEEMAGMGAYARRGLLSPESPAEKARRREVLERLGLGELKNRGVLSLSGGEYQKVLLSRLLIQDPLIFLLDEPANHLDLEHQLFIFSLVKEECQKGRAAAAVLHDINLALSYADKLLALDRGKPVYQGPPEAAALREVLEKLYHLPLAEYTGPGGRRLLWPFL
jgi:iron complex transport system ATP-binding protein